MIDDTKTGEPFGARVGESVAGARVGAHMALTPFFFLFGDSTKTQYSVASERVV